MVLLREMLSPKSRERREDNRHGPDDASVWVDSYRYRLTNMNRNAVRIAPDRGMLIERQSVSFRMELPIGEKPISIPLAGTVIRRDGGGLVIRFAEPQPFFRKLIDSYLAGQKRG